MVDVRQEHLSATLYPLTIKLQMLGMLDKTVPGTGASKRTLLDLIENIDVRVYKTRGTDPRADICRFTCSLKANTKLRDIGEWLDWYNRRWMSKPEFLTYLNGSIYGNRALPHIFIEYSEHLCGRPFTIDELKGFARNRKRVPTVEHILAQKPRFTLKTHGFKSTEEYLDFEHSLGNLTVLEKGLNSAAQDKSTVNKTGIYDKSAFRMTRNVSVQVSKTRKFDKSDIEKRTAKLAEYFSGRWWC